MIPLVVTFIYAQYILYMKMLLFCFYNLFNLNILPFCVCWGVVCGAFLVGWVGFFLVLFVVFSFFFVVV